MLFLKKRRDLNLAIVDYGMGNVGSVVNGFKKIGVSAYVASCQEDLKQADALVLPGVGAFSQAMKAILERDLAGPLNECVLEMKKPVLGICLGQQLMAQSSTEGGYCEGLGWIPGRVLHFDRDKTPRVPHVGWSSVVQTQNDDVLFYGNEEGESYYFTHSYMLQCPEEFVGSYCTYGEKFVASVRHENIFATQFHPEKSQFAGIKMLRNFSAYCLQYALEGEDNAQ